MKIKITSKHSDAREKIIFKKKNFHTPKQKTCTCTHLLFIKQSKHVLYARLLTNRIIINQYNVIILTLITVSCTFRKKNTSLSGYHYL